MKWTHRTMIFTKTTRCGILSDQKNLNTYEVCNSAAATHFQLDRRQSWWLEPNFCHNVFHVPERIFNKEISIRPAVITLQNFKVRIGKRLKN